MWSEEFISEAVVRQARCSSRQLVNSARMGKGYAPTGAFLSICTGPPARSMRSSRVLGASVVDVVVDMVRSPSLCGWFTCLTLDGQVRGPVPTGRRSCRAYGRQDGPMPDRS